MHNKENSGKRSRDMLQAAHLNAPSLRNYTKITNALIPHLVVGQVLDQFLRHFRELLQSVFVL